MSIVQRVSIFKSLKLIIDTAERVVKGVRVQFWSTCSNMFIFPCREEKTICSQGSMNSTQGSEKEAT